jgi:hypothetical protein
MKITTKTKVTTKTKFTIELNEDQAYALMSTLGETSLTQHVANGLTDKQADMMYDLYFKLTEIEEAN